MSIIDVMLVVTRPNVMDVLRLSAKKSGLPINCVLRVN